MEFGFGLITCQQVPGDDRGPVELYGEVLDLAREAERLGFDSVWVSEHHFVDDGYLPSLLPMCAAIAARTERIRIGTALLLAPLHEPLRLAEDAAVVDLISGGRLILGLGLGWREEEFDALGVSPQDRVGRLEDAIGVLRQAWAGELVTGSPRRPYDRVPVTPRPAQPSGPPIWIGALTPPAIRRAGRLAEGFMATDVTPGSFARQVALAREARAEAGLDPGSFVASLHLATFAWHGADAWERVRDPHRYVEWKYEDMDVARHRSPPPPAPPPPSAAEEEALRELILLGRPEEIVERIAAFRDAAGGDVHFIARLYWPGMDPAVRREAMEVFATEVIPKLT
jgi:alkanesulfonate monooxygenase SsuD/methylene tetrahydromethanopterin reductase-like flavin-dependent oxidoreductase (luciferase family)